MNYVIFLPGMNRSSSCLFSNSKNSRALRSVSKCLEMKRNWDPPIWPSNLSSASVLVKRITLENFFETIQFTKSTKNTSRCGPPTRPDLELLKWIKKILAQIDCKNKIKRLFRIYQKYFVPSWYVLLMEFQARRYNQS